jgi:hypothetical protein
VFKEGWKKIGAELLIDQYHPDPQARGLPMRCLGRCGRAELVADREDLFEDEATVVLYENEQFEEMMVSDLARQAVAAKQTTSGGNAS